MTRYQPTANESSWSEKKRLIRFRRKKEHLRFAEEIKLVSSTVFASLVALLVIGEFTILWLCDHNIPEMWPPVIEFGPKSGLALVGAIGFGVWLVIATLVSLIVYVHHDARRRGMNAPLWTFLVILMLPGYLAMGFVLYFTVREPLPYHCPKCGTMVNARFNYCPGCKYSLHPACPYCQAEVGEVDRYCPHCGNDVHHAPVPEAFTSRPMPS